MQDPKKRPTFSVVLELLQKYMLKTEGHVYNEDYEDEGDEDGTSTGSGVLGRPRTLSSARIDGDRASGDRASCSGLAISGVATASADQHRSISPNKVRSPSPKKTGEFSPGGSTEKPSPGQRSSTSLASSSSSSSSPSGVGSVPSTTAPSGPGGRTTVQVVASTREGKTRNLAFRKQSIPNVQRSTPPRAPLGAGRQYKSSAAGIAVNSAAGGVSGGGEGGRGLGANGAGGAGAGGKPVALGRHSVHGRISPQPSSGSGTSVPVKPLRPQSSFIGKGVGDAGGGGRGGLATSAGSGGVRLLPQASFGKLYCIFHFFRRGSFYESELEACLTIDFRVSLFM